MIYSSGRELGHPRCEVTNNYRSTLAQVPSHAMHCGEDNEDNTPTPLYTQRAEYSTEANGTIVVTTDGDSPMSLHCTGSVGCEANGAF